MRPEVFVPREKSIHDLLDLLGVLGMPMAEAVKGAELASFGGQVENLRHYPQGCLMDLGLNLNLLVERLLQERVMEFGRKLKLFQCGQQRRGPCRPGCVTAHV